MRRKWILWMLLIFLLPWTIDPAGQSPSVALADISSGESLILPQMFNLNPQNTSQVVLQNLSASQADLNVEFFAQDGSFVDLVPVTLAGMGEAQVATPTGPGGAPFVGSVLIFGNGPFTARGQWNFNIAGTPFFVGVPVISSNRATTTFQMPVGTVGANSLVGVAIENPGGAMISCTITYRNSSGQIDTTNEFAIPGFGQISEFASGITAGFEGSATVQCSGPATMTGVIQEQVNGFPTPLFACPVE